MMNFFKFLKKLQMQPMKGTVNKSDTEKTQPKLKIDESMDEEYEVVTITNVGLTTSGVGAVILKSVEGIEFPISAFSGEVAGQIFNFVEQKHNVLPTIYNMIEQICEESELLLVKVKVYESGDTLRANIYFTGKKDLVLRNYRASDAIALATFYGAPILVRKSLLNKNTNSSI
jgi:bifunctional DNase/RNase